MTKRKFWKEVPCIINSYDRCESVTGVHVHFTTTTAGKETSDKVKILSPKLSVYLHSQLFSLQGTNASCFLKSRQICKIIQDGSLEGKRIYILVIETGIKYGGRLERLHRLLLVFFISVCFNCFTSCVFAKNFTH